MTREGEMTEARLKKLMSEKRTVSVAKAVCS